MAGTIEDKIKDLVLPLLSSMGVSLWGVRFRGGHDHAKLQIYIDRPEGVDIDLCGDVTAMISPALDASDIIAPSYTLEISSPGLDRILFTREQAADYTGSEVKAELRIPVQGRRKLNGILRSVAADGTLSLDDKQSGLLNLAFENVAQLRLVPDFSSINPKKPQ